MKIKIVAHVLMTSMMVRSMYKMYNNTNIFLFQLRFIIDKFMDLRAEQKKILESNPKLTIGDVTTINLTQIYVSD